MDALSVGFPPTLTETEIITKNVSLMNQENDIPYISARSVHISPNSAHTSIFPHLQKIFYSLFGVIAEPFFPGKIKPQL